MSKKKAKNYDELLEQGIELIQFYNDNPCIAAYELLGVDFAPIQRLVFEDMWFKNYSIVIASRGLGKSQCVNSMCHFKQKGLVHLNEVLPKIPSYLKDGEDEILDYGRMIFTSEGYRSTKRLCLEKGINGKRLRTVNGFENRGSNHHPVLTINSDGEFIYKSLDKFVSGDPICICRGQMSFGDNKIPDDDAYLIGLFIGDGSLAKGYNPGITTADDEIKDFCVNYCITNNIDFRKADDSRTTNTSTIFFKDFKHFFEKYNIDRVLSYDKTVPFCIRTGTMEVQKAFLSGYFDADGTADSKSGNVSCCSVSKNLIQEIQMMLLNFGVVSKIRKKKTNSKFGKAYLLDMFSDGSLIFSSLIGFYCKRKQAVIDKYLELHDIPNPNKDIIPFVKNLCDNIIYDYRELNGNCKFDSNLPSLNSDFSGRKNLTYYSLSTFLGRVCGALREGYVLSENSINGLEKLHKIIDKHYYFDTVKSVEDWKGDCYDFEMEMEGEPNYFSNGFINHNTFMLGVLATLSCMLRPGYRVGLLSPVFRQSKLIFAEVEKMYAQSSILREACEKRPTRGSDTCYLKFKSVGGMTPSFIEALPLGDGCLTNCNYLTFYGRFGRIGDAHDLNVEENHYIDRNEIVWSNGEFRGSDRSLCNGVKDTIKIKTKKGFDSEGTPNHKFKVVRNGKMVWCRFDEMEIGDRVPIDRSYRWHNGDSDITKEQSFALGFLIGDGCWTDTRKCLSFATKDIDVLSVLKAGIGCDYLYEATDNVHYIACSDKKYITQNDVREKWMDFWGVESTHAINKKLPKKILSASRENMSECISGLFAADGHIQVSTAKGGTSITIGFTNTSEELIDQLHYILLHYGIVAYKTERDRNENWSTVYELLITGPAVKIFYEEIGFGLARKDSILKAAIESKTKWFAYEDIPGIKDIMVDISSNNRIKRGEGSVESRYCRASVIKNKKYITPHIVDCFLKSYTHVDDCRLDILRSLNNPDIFYDEITDIQAGKACTYDIHVPDGNEYCANGFFSHNSKIRGSRFYLVVIDELAQVPDQILDMVIRPMGATSLAPMERVRRIEQQQRLISLNLAAATDFEEETVNKMVMASSGYYKFNHMWRRMKDHWRQMKEAELNGEESPYCVWQIPYWDLPVGFLDTHNIEEARRIMSNSEFRMEYEAAMISDSEGFFKASLLDECTRGSGHSIELKGDAKGQYVIGVDPNQGGKANCGLVIIKLGPVNRVVSVLELRGKTTQDLTVAVQDVCDTFNVVRIFMDKGGGGKAICDLLEEGYNGRTPIIDRTNDDHRHLDGRHILELVHFNPAWISDANFTTKAMLEDKKLLFPEAPIKSTLDMEALAYDNVNTLKSQMLNIIVTQTATGVLHFDTPTKGQNKDLYSAVILAAHGARLVEKEFEEQPDLILYGQGGLIRMHNPGATFDPLIRQDGPKHGNVPMSAAVLKKKIK